MEVGSPGPGDGASLSELFNTPHTHIRGSCVLREARSSLEGTRRTRAHAGAHGPPAFLRVVHQNLLPSHSGTPSRLGLTPALAAVTQCSVCAVAMSPVGARGPWGGDWGRLMSVDSEHAVLVQEGPLVPSRGHCVRTWPLADSRALSGRGRLACQSQRGLWARLVLLPRHPRPCHSQLNETSYRVYVRSTGKTIRKVTGPKIVREKVIFTAPRPPLPELHEVIECELKKKPQRTKQ